MFGALFKGRDAAKIELFNTNISKARLEFPRDDHRQHLAEIAAYEALYKFHVNRQAWRDGWYDLPPSYFGKRGEDIIRMRQFEIANILNSFLPMPSNNSEFEMFATRVADSAEGKKLMESVPELCEFFRIKHAVLAILYYNVQRFLHERVVPPAVV